MSRVCSVDCGTMFFHVAEQTSDGIDIKVMRNAFVELPASEDVEEILGRNNWKWVKDGNSYYVLGEDSLRVANMFPDKVQLRRPMQDGVLNKGEEKKMLIMAEMIESALGKAPDDQSIVCTCVSSESADGSVDSTFHKARLMGMFKRLGWHTKVIEEGLAVVWDQRPTTTERDDDGKEVEIPYSGIGLSLGAGRANCVLAYKGYPVVGASVARSGDWIDKKVADATGEPISQVTRIKERKLNFDELDIDNDVIFALDTYYESMLAFVFERFKARFAKVKSDFEYPIEIVVAGGTSMPKGFCTKAKEVLDSIELPFEIKNVRHADDPRNSIVKGLLTHALFAKKRMDKGESTDI